MIPAYFKSIKFQSAFIFVLSISSLSYSKPFLIANFDSVYKSAAGTIAILPVVHSSIEEDGPKIATKMRASMYKELSKREEKYTLQLQHPEETDSLLLEAGLSDSQTAQMPIPKLCKVLGVDVVMHAKILEYRKGLPAPFTGSFTNASIIPGRNSTLSAEISIYSGGDGQLLWHDKIEKLGKASYSDDIWKQAGKSIAKEFPYRR